MNIRSKIVAALLASGLGLAGCASPAFVSPVSVTRFVAPQAAQLGSGTIAVVPAPGLGVEMEGAFAADFRTYADALGAALADQGYTVVPAADAAQVAELRFDTAVLDAAQRSPVNVGVGGSTGSYGSGVGVGVGINLGGRKPDSLDRSIGVVIRDKASTAVLWEGRASFSATDNSDYADNDAAAMRLAYALMEGFPGNDGETIEVE
ncbi:DUF4136 domain-containing protein [Paraurantiacibacter namhicola]|uniref:DUF4136 domain-containing protein n=1 Tax=Paraurantiacibacter namhicola TaxID=645517 RepID=A0A1C7D508_9SPHN|nr:DUF4136 domain-containing protein [Paraurantiacibacter namhicola]ANU06411.1 hypothetical protein A6F65_00083 [Paraurantiacibacter namhicola]